MSPGTSSLTALALARLALTSAVMGCFDRCGVADELVQTQWIDPAGGDWVAGDNWSTGIAPGPADVASFALNAPDFYDVGLDVPASIDRLEVARDRMRLVLGPAGSLQVGGFLAVQVGVGLAAGQASRLHVVGGTLQTTHVLVGLVPLTSADLEIAGGAAWSANGFVTLGFGGGGASLTVRDGSMLSSTGSLQMLGGFSADLPTSARFLGDGATAIIGGDLTTSASVNVIDVWDGAQLVVGGDVHIVTSNVGTPIGGIDIKGGDAALSIGGSLDIGGGLWGRVRVRSGGTLDVAHDVLLGVTPGVEASVLLVDGGAVQVLGDVRLGSDPGSPSGHLDLESGTVTVAGAIRALERDPLNAIEIAGPSTLAGPIDLSSSWVSSGMTVHAGGMLETPGLAIAPGAQLSGAGGAVAGAITIEGTLDVGISGATGSAPRLGVNGSLDLLPSALTAVQLSSTPTTEVARLVDVEGAATVDGDLDVDVSFMWWSGPRRPVEIVRATRLMGSFATVNLAAAPYGPPLELRQTATTIRVQADFIEDLDDDGLVDSADMGVLLAAWGPGPSPADFNGDGTVDGADLAMLLARWNGL